MSQFEESLNALNKPHDSKNLLKILLTIRKEVEWPKNKDQISKLRQKGCLKQFIKMFNMNKNIIDICLSIIGNCIMDKGCARDAVGVYNVLTPLSQLLKRYPDEDSINGRIFRIIGNICNHKDQWANIIIDKQSEIVVHGIELIKNFSKENITDEKRNSEATVLMTIRALRLLQNRRTIISLVRNFEVLKVIGSLFIKLSQEWQENGKNDILLQNIIKLLYDYSKYKFYQSIQQMRNTDRGDSLLYLSNVLLLAPKRIVKIIMNFIRISQLKSELPIPEICDKFIDVLLKNLKEKDFQEDCVEYIECLCLMFKNPMIRNNDRCSKCITLLVEIIGRFDTPSKKELDLCILIVATLNQCSYEDSLIQKQLKCNVIEILLKKMEWIVGESSKMNKHHKKNKKPRNDMIMKYLDWESRESEHTYGKRRKCILDEVYDLNSSLLSPQSLYSSDEERFDRASSPCSSIDSEYQSSPCSSPPPRWMTNTESDSDDYSPVCSEADPSEFVTIQNNDKQTDDDVNVNINDICEVEELEEDDISLYPEKKDEAVDVVKIRLLMEITNLIKCFTRVRPPLPQLGTDKLLWTLLKLIDTYSSLSNCTSLIDVIGRILDSPEYLIPLMSTGFIETVYDLTILQHADCGTCMDFLSYGKFVLKKLTTLAESESGKGDIAHSLLRGADGVKEKLVLVIPYIIWDKTILAKLMLDCGGLKKLMELLQQESTLNERICKVLCAMATKNLKIANPKDVALNLGKRKLVHLNTYTLDSACKSVVTLKLDDGTTLRADREFLCEKSDFFSRLLNGHFKESNEDEITLHNVEHKSLECLLQLLSSVDKSSDVEIRLDLETLLDVILLCDRYLMQDLCGYLLNSVEKFRMSRKTVPVIYKWSLDSQTNLLRIESIAYALVADLSVNQRLKMFEELFTLGYSSELLEDIHKLLARYLRSSESYRK